MLDKKLEGKRGLRAFGLTILLSILFCSNIFAHRETTYLLHGTFGERKVAIEIIDVDGYWSGRYFFKDEKRDVFLVANCETNHCKLVVKKFDADQKKDILIEELVINEDTITNHWFGTWIDKNQKSWPVSLRPIVQDSIKHNFSNTFFYSKISLYNQLKLSDIELVKIDQVKYKKGMKLVYYQDTLSKLTGFRIKGRISGKKKKLTNNLLEREQVTDMMNYYACGSIGYTGIYKQKIDIKFVNKHVISYKKDVIANCYGHTDQSDVYYHTLNVDSGIVLKLDNVLWFESGKGLRHGSQEYFKYRYKVFGNEVLKVFLELYPELLEGEDCNYNNSKLWQFPEWYISEKGIHLINQNISLKKKCKAPEGFIIPFKGYESNINVEYFIEELK